MSREDPFLVRHTGWPPLGEANGDRAVLNRAGAQIVVDFLDQLVLGGWAYHMQIGTMTTPVNSTDAIDDQLVWMMMDNNAGYAFIPLMCEVNVDFVDTAVSGEIMLEVDLGKKRYSSGGTAFVPKNLRGDGPNSHNGVAYVGTDVTTLAKTAVPGSVELARMNVNEDVVTDPTTGKFLRDATLYSVRRRPLIVGVDASSLLVHFGAGTADLNGFGVLQWAQVAKGLLV